MDYRNLIENQRTFFQQGGTSDIKLRKRYLSRVKIIIKQEEQKILDALASDLHKNNFEAYMSEVGLVLDEIGYILRHMERWAKPKRVRTPLTQFPAKSFIMAEPYGVVLVMAPWNYPFLLCMAPLIGALCAGNTVVLKPSAYAPHTSKVIAQLLGKIFDPEYVAVVQGGREENEALLEHRFDYLFFTGSVEVGKIVMNRAARFLTPVSLELGGKSPAIVDSTADIPLAAKRIIFGKMMNAGQTCIAPDYVLADKHIKDKLIYHMKQYLDEFFPGKDYENLPRIINEKHFHRIMGLIKDEKVIIGGKGNETTLAIEPTIVEPVGFDSPIMQEEIFGPILPILTYHSIDEAMLSIVSRPNPLALYLFTNDKATEDAFMRNVSFGGGCINDTIVHIATPHMGFGGVGESGMGSYHGKFSFETFTHFKGIVKRSKYLDFPFRYHPHTEKKFRLVRKLLR
ncbi:aldehyde dehydrogenase [Pleomorphochaeta sp. DL1XJH-081]|uniref:aldehyde dehydrogenase n=1 Tax=Pleomorphochaeta sp. DL1XJH-081 TaxID=3409690 RepID=UPI003BB5BF21